MTRYLVDTGVFVRWFIDQDGWEHARKIRDEFVQGAVILETVDFVRIETANVLRKAGLLKGILTPETFATLARAIDDLGILAHITDADVLERGARLATSRNVAVYDAIVVVRAMELGIPLLTSDQRLCRAVDGLVQTELLQGVGAPTTNPGHSKPL